MILLSGFNNGHKFIWYSKFTGMNNMSTKDDFSFYEHKELLDDLLQFTANYIYDRIRKERPNIRIKDARTLVVEAFKHDHTFLCFNGYNSIIDNLPHLFIEFFNNPIIREFVTNAETVRFVLDMREKHKTIDTENRRTMLEDYDVKIMHKISYYNGGANGKVDGVIIPDNYVAIWDKTLKYKLEESN